MHLLIPMSGQGVRYQKAGFKEPKPLIPVSGVPMIERLLTAFPAHWRAHFVLAENHRETELPPLLKKLRPDCTLHWVPPHTLGPGHAVQTALGSGQIPSNEPVLVSYCDYGMVWDAAAFERFTKDSECDACVISYRGFHAHYLSPVTYAYSRLEGESVREVKEKGSFTSDREQEYASSGGYYFRTAALLREALKYQFDQKVALNGEYYISLTVESLLRARPSTRARVFEIPGFFQWGTPEDLMSFEYWERTFQGFNRFTDPAPGTYEVDQVLMPMAGLGSRFRDISPLPKPLIPVGGTPMFSLALDSLPRPTIRSSLVALESFADTVAAHAPTSATITRLKTTPSGQALSTEAGIDTLDASGEVFVSACDHAIVLDPAKWSRFHARPDCDAAIFTVQGFPGTLRRPRAFSYVVPKAGDLSAFPEVERVSVKEPATPDIRKNHLLVGTFWFSSAQLLKAGIEELKKRDIRVNSELYLDSVFDVLASMGKRVRLIPLDGYIGWGDPESLCEALYWQEIFTGRRLDTRPRFPGIQKGKDHA